jgi:hypothetical protein
MEEVVKISKMFFPKDKTKKVLIYANLDFFGCLEVRNWRLFRGQDGKSFEIGYPNAPLVTGAKKFYRQVVPTTPEIQKMIQEVMVSGYNAALKAKEDAHVVF